MCIECGTKVKHSLRKIGKRKVYLSSKDVKKWFVITTTAKQVPGSRKKNSLKDVWVENKGKKQQTTPHIKQL